MNHSQEKAPIHDRCMKYLCLKPNLVRDVIERPTTALESKKSSKSERLGVEARPTLKHARASMKLTAATMMISPLFVHPFECLGRALKNVSDEIRLKLIGVPLKSQFQDGVR